MKLHILKFMIHKNNTLSIHLVLQKGLLINLFNYFFELLK